MHVNDNMTVWMISSVPCDSQSIIALSYPSVTFLSSIWLSFVEILVCNCDTDQDQSITKLSFWLRHITLMDVLMIIYIYVNKSSFSNNTLQLTPCNDTEVDYSNCVTQYIYYITYYGLYLLHYCRTKCQGITSLHTWVLNFIFFM
jgi:hypothetical protein